jgi:hypothetical protein
MSNPLEDKLDIAVISLLRVAGEIALLLQAKRGLNRTAVRRWIASVDTAKAQLEAILENK